MTPNKPPPPLIQMLHKSHKSLRCVYIFLLSLTLLLSLSAATTTTTANTFNAVESSSTLNPAGSGSTATAAADSFHKVSFVFSWGSNHFSQLAHKPTVTQISPHQQSTHHYEKIACGIAHCVALMGDGEREEGEHTGSTHVHSFGTSNQHGQLGDGSTSQDPISPHDLVKTTFPSLKEDEKIISVDANAFWSAALTSQGRYFSWGETYAGNGEDEEDYLSPELLTTQEGDDMHGKKIRGFSLGTDWTLFVDELGEAYALGSNLVGQLGVADPAVVLRLKPVRIQQNFPENGVQRVLSVAAGKSTSYVILKNGNVLCFGNAEHGVCADGNTEPHVLHKPFQIPFEKFSKERVVQVVCGQHHAVARTDAGRLYAWGMAHRGQLGNGNTNVKAQGTPVTVILPPQWERQDVHVIDMQSVDDSTLVLLSDGRMGAFGDNSMGALMHNILTVHADVIDGPSLVRDLKVSAFGLAQRFTSVVDEEGALYEVSGSHDKSLSPQLMYYEEGSALSSVIVDALAGGVESTAVLTSEGNLVTLGGNKKNELAAGDEESELLAEHPFNDERVVPKKALITEGSQYKFSNKLCLAHHGLVLNKDTSQQQNQLFAWGDNSELQLGTSSTSSSNVVMSTPSGNLQLEKPLTEKIIQVACGVSKSAFVTDEGNVYTFGRGSQGLGDGTFEERQTAQPVPLTGALATKKLSQVQIGRSHFLLLSTDGAMFTFGSNQYSALGNPSINRTSPTSNPVRVELDPSLGAATRNVILISAATNGDHNLALTESRDEILCWGLNTFGQCGTGNTNEVERALLVDTNTVLRGKTFVSVAAGEAFSLILSSTGEVFGQGSNVYGELGIDSDIQRYLSPVRVSSSNIPADTEVRLIAAGARHALSVVDYHACYGVPAFSSSVCSSHGRCIKSTERQTTSCECDDEKQWIGEKCDVPVCFGLAASNEDSCSGEGYCYAPDKCICNKNYIGKQCEIQVLECGTMCIIAIISLSIGAMAALCVFIALVALGIYVYTSKMVISEEDPHKKQSKKGSGDVYHKMAEEGVDEETLVPEAAADIELQTQDDREVETPV